MLSFIFYVVARLGNYINTLSIKFEKDNSFIISSYQKGFKPVLEAKVVFTTTCRNLKLKISITVRLKLTTVNWK